MGAGRFFKARLAGGGLTMSLKLYFHPLASFCHKALIALYENGIRFEPVVVDLADETSRAAFRAVWPMAKMPALRDDARDRTVAESTIIVEYLDTYYPGATRFLPADPERAWQTRMWDRFYDHYVQVPMQKIVMDALRPAGRNDAFGVEQAQAQLREAYAVIEQEMAVRTWMMDDAFTLVDCAAAPALFYANTVGPLRGDAEQADGLPRPPDGAAVLCAGARGGAAPLCALPIGEQAANRQTWRKSRHLAMKDIAFSVAEEKLHQTDASAGAFGQMLRLGHGHPARRSRGRPQPVGRRRWHVRPFGPC